MHWFRRATRDPRKKISWQTPDQALSQAGGWSNRTSYANYKPSETFEDQQASSETLPDQEILNRVTQETLPDQQILNQVTQETLPDREILNRVTQETLPDQQILNRVTQETLSTDI